MFSSTGLTRMQTRQNETHLDSLRLKARSEYGKQELDGVRKYLLRAAVKCTGLLGARSAGVKDRLMATSALVTRIATSYTALHTGLSVSAYTMTLTGRSAAAGTHESTFTDGSKNIKPPTSMRFAAVKTVTN
ncbi:hypothetical protein HPB51_019187 [Rhipicephalus microplus]|uniref:Uncharacterized protein n=1 Tax=Rhipicephalus microplus TaxID=6941 RepID=A0A9J6EB54_RHIMP|nr:hypothetical protein HPB51_019187 [Rhipicephalus microplus]